MAGPRVLIDPSFFPAAAKEAFREKVLGGVVGDHVRFEVEKHGQRKLLRKLNELPKRTHKKHLRPAMQAGLKPIKKRAKETAPRMNRLLARSIDHKIQQYKGAVFGVVGQRKRSGIKSKSKRRKAGGISGRNQVVPIHLVEKKTRRHRIASYKGVLAFRPAGARRNAKLIFAKRVKHPGTKATRFMRRAERSTRVASRRAFNQKLSERLEKEATKNA